MDAEIAKVYKKSEIVKACPCLVNREINNLISTWIYKINPLTGQQFIENFIKYKKERGRALFLNTPPDKDNTNQFTEKSTFTSCSCRDYKKGSPILICCEQEPDDRRLDVDRCCVYDMVSVTIFKSLDITESLNKLIEIADNSDFVSEDENVTKHKIFEEKQTKFNLTESNLQEHSNVEVRNVEVKVSNVHVNEVNVEVEKHFKPNHKTKRGSFSSKRFEQETIFEEIRVVAETNPRNDTWNFVSKTATKRNEKHSKQNKNKRSINVKSKVAQRKLSKPSKTKLVQMVQFWSCCSIRHHYITHCDVHCHVCAIQNGNRRLQKNKTIYCRSHCRECDTKVKSRKEKIDFSQCEESLPEPHSFDRCYVCSYEK